MENLQAKVKGLSDAVKGQDGNQNDGKNVTKSKGISLPLHKRAILCLDSFSFILSVVIGLSSYCFPVR